MERSELLAETLGDHVFEWFIRNKRAEWAALQDPRDPVRARPLPAAALSPRRPTARIRPDQPAPDRERGSHAMEPLLCFPCTAPGR